MRRRIQGLGDTSRSAEAVVEGTIKGSLRIIVVTTSPSAHINQFIGVHRAQKPCQPFAVSSQSLVESGPRKGIKSSP